MYVMSAAFASEDIPVYEADGIYTGAGAGTGSGGGWLACIAYDRSDGACSSLPKRQLSRIQKETKKGKREERT